MLPIAIFKLNAKRSRELIATHSLLHNRQGKPKTVVSDIMRASVVMIVAAVDAYLHGLVGQYVGRAAQLTPPPAALLDLIKDWKLDAKEVLPFLLNQKGPSELQELVSDHFADRTLQDPSKVEQVCRVLGVASVWADAAAQLNRPEVDVRREFAAAVKRRHQIAHEADLDPDGRTETKKRTLKKEQASQYIDQIEAVALAIQAVLEARYPERGAA